MLWIQLCRLADPNYKYKSEKNNNNNNNNNKNSGEPKKHLESLSSVWMNSFEILADPVPSDPMQPVCEEGERGMNRGKENRGKEIGFARTNFFNSNYVLFCGPEEKHNKIKVTISCHLIPILSLLLKSL